MSVLDNGNPGEEDLLHVLTARQEDLENTGDLIAVAPGLCSIPGNTALRVKHKPGLSTLRLQIKLKNKRKKKRKI